ncbi:MAG: type II toxin-antitoxin system RelE/ParE family toxin [Oscillospiraceae bacterium]|nr:type II toxin-antitoxin system RelE/ParE family toxin [Oscillospiraceae bacterium]
MNIIYYKQAVKVLEHMDYATKHRIKCGIESMPKGDIKKLRGHIELYRLRIGDWRILFSYIDNETVLIEKISTRGEVYKGV